MFPTPMSMVCCDECGKKITSIFRSSSIDYLVNVETKTELQNSEKKLAPKISLPRPPRRSENEEKEYYCFRSLPENKIYKLCNECFQKKKFCCVCMEEISPITDCVESLEKLFKSQKEGMKDNKRSKRSSVDLQCLKCSLKILSYENISKCYPRSNFKGEIDNKNNIPGLNDDCFNHIVSFLFFPNDIIMLSLVCKKWYQFIFESSFSFLKQFNFSMKLVKSPLMKRRKYLYQVYCDYNNREFTLFTMKKLMFFLSLKNFKGFPVMNKFDIDFFNIRNLFYWSFISLIIPERNNLKTMVVSKSNYKVFLKKIGDIKNVECCVIDNSSESGKKNRRFINESSNFKLIEKASNLKTLIIKEPRSDISLDISNFKLLERIRTVNRIYNYKVEFVGCNSMAKSSCINSVYVDSATVSFKDVSLKQLKVLKWIGSSHSELDFVEELKSLKYLKVLVEDGTHKAIFTKVAENNVLTLQALKFNHKRRHSLWGLDVKPSDGFYKNMRLRKLKVMSLDVGKINNTKHLYSLNLGLINDEEVAKSILKGLKRFTNLEVLHLNFTCYMLWFKLEMIDFLKDYKLLKRLSFAINLKYHKTINRNAFFDYLSSLISKCKCLKSFHNGDRMKKEDSCWEVLPLFKTNQLEELDLSGFDFPKQSNEKDFLKEIQLTKLKMLGVNCITQKELDYIVNEVTNIKVVYFSKVVDYRRDKIGSSSCYDKNWKMYV